MLSTSSSGLLGSGLVRRSGGFEVRRHWGASLVVVIWRFIVGPRTEANLLIALCVECVISLHCGGAIREANDLATQAK